MNSLHSLFARICIATVLGACVLLSANSAPDRATVQADVGKLQDQVHALDKDVSVFNAKLDAQDKRIQDIQSITASQANHIGMVANQTTNLGNYISITNIAVAILAFAAGLITYLSATSKAKQEARDASTQWLKENAKALQDEIAEIKKQASQAHKEIETIKENVKKIARDAIHVIAKKVLAAETTSELTPNERADLQTIFEALKHKPEADFTANNYFARGLAEYDNQHFESALAAFEQAQKLISETAPTIEQLEYLFAKGVTLSRLNRNEDALAIYDLIDQRYSTDTTIAIREEVTRVLFNKGVTLNRLKRNDDAIAVYDLIDQRYSTDTTPAIRALVAIALVNKGITLRTLNRSDDAIAVYDLIEKRYSTDTTPAIREHVAKALINKGFHLLTKAKQQWTDTEQRKHNLDQALISLGRALTQCNTNDKSIVHGNKGYVLFLQGNFCEAEVDTRTCMQLGGEKSLEAQRADAQQNRIEPEDTQYEAMLTRLWNELNGDSSNKASA